mgnify:FL=1
MDFLVSITPILSLFALMLIFRMSGWKSAVITLAITVGLMLLLSHRLGIVPSKYADAPILSLAAYGVLEGVLKAIFPILLIILTALFSYNLLVESKQIDVIKQQISSLTDDKGISVLVLTWGFGGLLEGMAGFGTAVAIPAAILIGLGFKPFFSALVSLLANTVATCFGAVGVSLITLCNEGSVGGMASPEMIREISVFAILQLSPLFFLVPLAILMLTDKSAWLKNVILSLWVGSVSLGVQIICALYLGAETPAIIGSIAAIFALIIASKFVKTKGKPQHKTSFKEFFKAWSVYIFILLLILLSGPLCPPANAFLKSHLVMNLSIPVLGTQFKFGWLSNAAVMILLGSILGGLVQGVSLKKQLAVFAKTLIGLRYTTITIVCLISMASVMNYSGMITTIASGMIALTGSYYPLFAPIIGAIGTFVTGSDTSSNILFAKLQASAAHHLGMTGTNTYLGVTGSETNWLLSANSTGATGGKMISPQSVAIATAACEMENSDAALLRAALPYALAYVAIGGLMVLLCQ